MTTAFGIADPPGRTGLYDPRFEHDACGVSFVAHMKGVASHELVQTGLRALTNLEHRGATGAEPDTGDGAGVLLQMPDRLLRESVGFELPPLGQYACGVVFLPPAARARETVQRRIAEIMAEEDITVLGWREVPVDPACLGKTALAAMPSFAQLFVSSPGGEASTPSPPACPRYSPATRERAEPRLASSHGHTGSPRRARSRTVTRCAAVATARAPTNTATARAGCAMIPGSTSMTTHSASIITPA